MTLYGSVSWNVCARSWHMTWPAACLWPLTSQGRQTWMKHESFGEAESESPTADSTSYSSYLGYNTYWQNLTKCAKVIARYDNMTMVEYYIPVYIKISWEKQYDTYCGWQCDQLTPSASVFVHQRNSLSAVVKPLETVQDSTSGNKIAQDSTR